MTRHDEIMQRCSNGDEIGLDVALALADEVDALIAWVNDLQSGMYINCVYCGHRYGPNDEVPATMADVLKEHISQCPKHPMSALIAQRDEWKRRCEAVVADAQRWSEDACYCDFNRHGDRTLRCEYCEQTERILAIAEGRDNG